MIDSFHSRIAEATVRPLEEVFTDFRARRLLSARQAMLYGLIDEIAESRHLRSV
jgi:ATP-dependent protease ClpP protease subunit